MAMENSSTTVDELIARLHRLACLSQPTVAHLVPLLRDERYFSTPEHLAGFEYFLALVEYLAEQVTHPAFHSLSAELRVENNPRRLLRRLGAGCKWPWNRLPKWPWDWYLFADDLSAANPAGSLYCALNGWVSPQHSHWDQMHAGIGLMGFALCRLGFHAVAATILAWFFELPEFGLTAREVRERLDEHLGPDEMRITRLDWFLNGLRCWLQALRGCNRITDAACIVDAWLDVESGHYDAKTLQPAVQSRMGGAPSEFQARFILEAAEVLQTAGRPGDAVELFLALLKAGGSDVHGPGAYFRQCRPQTRALIVSATAAALRANGMPRRAADEIDIWLRIKSIDQVKQANRRPTETIQDDEPRSDDDRLIKRPASVSKDDPTLKTRVEQLNRIIRECGRSYGFLVARELAASVTAAGDPRAATLLLLSLVDLKYFELVHADKYLRETFEREFHGLSLNERLLFVETLVRALDSPELSKHWATLRGPILALTTVACDDFRWLAESDQPVDANTAIGMMLLWLDVCAGHGQVVSAELLDRFVTWLRSTRVSTSLSPEDRLLLARRTSQLRWKIIQAAREAAIQAPDLEAGNAIAKQALLWEQELGQRGALERLLLSVPSHVAVDGAPEPANRLPFPTTLVAGYLSRALASSEATHPAVVLRAEIADTSTSEPAQLSDMVRRDRPPWFYQAVELVAGGVQESKLAALLGEEGLLLQLGFARTGGVLWKATRSDGHSLQIVAQDRSDSSKWARQRIRWAVAHHELTIAVATMDADRQAKWTQFVEQEQGMLTSLVAKLHDSDEELRLAVVQRDFPSELRRLERRLKLPALDAILTPLLAPPREWIEFDQWADTVPRELGTVLELFMSPARLLSASQPTILNRATDELLAEVGRHCCLDELQGHLKSDHTNLVIQASDAWHGVPVAYLPLAGAPLFQQVRSIRSSFSTLLDELAQRIEESLPEEHRMPQNLLCVSWFDAEDPCWSQAFELHRAHHELGPVCYAAAQDPQGRTTTLLRGIQTRPYRVVTVLGHGTDRGVKLAPDIENGPPGYWRGQGIDLTAVELLLLVSCSFGRVRETGERDVDGFCVEQAIHRCRAAIACRWPVLADEAVRFANKLVQKYVERARGESAHLPALRALAVNDARKHFFGAASPKGRVGLNTAAAFELYGLG